MTEQLWTLIDRHITDRLVPADPALEATLAASAAAGLPEIQVAANQGKLLGLLARIQGARMILEIGTLGGYSTIWLARALPAGGRLVTLEADPRHAEVARANLAGAGLAEVVEVLVGPALATLPQLVAEGRGPFDLVFIDADKANNPEYVIWAMKLARVGTVIIVDNVVRKGTILDAASEDPDVQGTRRLYNLLGAHPRLSATPCRRSAARATTASSWPWSPHPERALGVQAGSMNCRSSSIFTTSPSMAPRAPKPRKSLRWISPLASNPA